MLEFSESSISVISAELLLFFVFLTHTKMLWLWMFLPCCLIAPGFKLLLEVFSVIHGPQEECVRALRNGHLLGISPGGVREALFSDETYPLLWGKRKGFAQVAIDSQVVCCYHHLSGVHEIVHHSYMLMCLSPSCFLQFLYFSYTKCLLIFK